MANPFDQFDQDANNSVPVLPVDSPAMPAPAPAAPRQSRNPFDQFDAASEPQQPAMPGPAYHPVLMPGKGRMVGERMGDKPAPLADANAGTYQTYEWGDAPSHEPVTKLTDAQHAEYLALARNPHTTADQLRAWAHGQGFEIANADQIVDGRNKGAGINPNVAYQLPNVPSHGAVSAFAHKAGDLPSFGFLDEAGAVVDALGGTKDRPNIWNSKMSFGDLYDRNLDFNRAELEADSNEHPIASTAGEVTGGLLLAPVEGVAGEAAGLSRLPGAVRAGVQGTATGALYGAGSSEGGLGNRAKGAALSAAVTGPLSAGGDALFTRMGNNSVRAAQRGQEVLDAADNLNARYGTEIAPLPAQVGGTGTRYISNGSEMTLLGGRQLRRGADNMMDQTQQAAEGVAAAAAPNARDRTMIAAATDLKRSGDPGSLVNLPERIDQRTEGLYSQAARQAGSVRLTTPQTVRTLDGIIDRLRQNPSEVPGLDRLVDLRERLASGNYTVRGLRDLRTSFGDSLEANNRTVRNAANQLWGPLSEDIQQGLTSRGLADAARSYRRADLAYQHGLAHKELVSTLLDNASSEDVAKRLLSMSREDADSLRNVMRLSNPDEAQSIQAGIINHLGRATAANQDAAGEAFSLSTFLTNWNKLSPRTKQLVFRGQVRDDLNDLATLAQSAKQAGVFRNSSHTAASVNFASVIHTLGRFGSGLQLAGTVAKGVVSPGTAVGEAAASWTIGRLMSSPGFARYVVTPWVKTGMTRAQLLNRLNKVIARLGGGEAAQQMTQFRDYVQNDPDALASQ